MSTGTNWSTRIQFDNSHYSKLAIQPIDIMRADFSHEELRGFLMGNILKRLLRWKYKDGLQDLRKARVELNELIRLETRDSDAQP